MLSIWGRGSCVNELMRYCCKVKRSVVGFLVNRRSVTCLNFFGKQGNYVVLQERANTVNMIFGKFT